MKIYEDDQEEFPMKRKNSGIGKQERKMKINKSLKDFLKKNEDIVIKTETFGTNLNDSMMKVVLPKYKTFNTTNKARVAVAVDRNNNYIFDSSILDTFCLGCIFQIVMAESLP